MGILIDTNLANTLIEDQFNVLQDKYQTLSIEKTASADYLIFGVITFQSLYKDLTINGVFTLEILIPHDYPKELPTVNEVGGLIPDDFHRYRNKTLCLGIPSDIRSLFLAAPTLLGFVENCIIPYLCAFSHWKQTGIRPAQELSHGGAGVYQAYKKLLKIDNIHSLHLMLKILIEDKYRGHDFCPCGSGVLMRKCHGPQLLSIKKMLSIDELKIEYEQVQTTIDQINKPSKPLALL